jgi:hypothetical protein
MTLNFAWICTCSNALCAVPAGVNNRAERLAQMKENCALRVQENAGDVFEGTSVDLAYVVTALSDG